MPFAVGAKVWVKDVDEAYVTGEVVAGGSPGKANVNFTATGKVAEIPNDDLEERVDQPSVGEMDDMQLLNMPSVLQNIDMRFCQEQCSGPGEGPVTIYSSVGPLLVAMNPFTRYNIYDENWMMSYHRATSVKELKKLGPHVYRTAQDAYERLQRATDVSVVICGESGAGKTYTNKLILDYLCKIAGQEGGAAVSPDKIAKANVLLESFGNAKTTRNHNSSRFGKFSQLKFEEIGSDYKICGVTVNHYLLERLRVVSQQPGERNYHIFYQLLRNGVGAKYGVAGAPEDYQYTKVGADVKIGELDDQKDFEEMMEQMKVVVTDETERNSIDKTMLGVLCMGNIDIKGDRDTSSVASDSSSQTALKKASELLGINEQALAEGMCVKYRQGPPGTPAVKQQVGKEEAVAQRDTLAKAIYSKVFDGLVSAITKVLRAKSGRLDKRRSIGLLDIFGFEDMMINGFEQMFINLTNEVIQDLFNNIMFNLELEVYRTEEVDYEFDTPEDRQRCLDLFLASKTSIVRSLKGAVELGGAGADGETLVRNFNQLFARPKDPDCPYKACGPREVRAICLEKGILKKGQRGMPDGCPTAENSFIIKHYAGDVLYTVDQWKPKSSDRLVDHLMSLTVNSSEGFVQGLFDESDEDASAAKSVGEKFREELKGLQVKLKKGDVLFVRCIKSNKELEPQKITRPLVLEQLRCGGVISALNVRRSGLPDRMEFDDFIDQFRGLEEVKAEKRSARDRCEKLLKPLFLDHEQVTTNKKLKSADQEFAIGKSMVFMKSHCRSFLSIIKQHIMGYIFQAWSAGKIISKITGAWETLEEAKQAAAAANLMSMATVAAAIQEAETALTPWHNKLKKEQAAGKSDQDIEKLFEPDKETIRTLRRTAEDSLGKIFRIKQRKAQAEQIMKSYLSLLGGPRSKVLTNKVKKVQKDCADFGAQVDPGDLAKCEAACSAAMEALKALSFLIPTLKNSDPQGVDYESSGEFKAPAVEVICPKAAAAFSTAQQAVEKALELGEAVLIVRRRFLEALEEFEPEFKKASELLESLGPKTEQFSAEGMYDILKIIEEAVTKESIASDIYDAAKDAEGYKAAVMAFSEAVKEADEAVKKGNKELLRRAEERKKEEALRDAVSRLNTALEETVLQFEAEYSRRPLGFKDDKDGSTRKEVGEFQKEQEDIDRALVRLGEKLTPGMRLSEERVPLERLQAEFDEVEGEFHAARDKIMGLVKEAEKKGKSAFADRLKIFQNFVDGKSDAPSDPSPASKTRKKFKTQASLDFEAAEKMKPRERSETAPAPAVEEPPAPAEAWAEPAAAPADAPAASADTVAGWCASIGVPEFAEVLESEGIEAVEEIQYIAADLEDLLKSLTKEDGWSFGKKAKVRRAVTALAA